MKISQEIKHRAQKGVLKSKAKRIKAFLILLLSSRLTIQSNSKFEITVTDTYAKSLIDCSDTTKTNIYTVRLKNKAANPLSLNLVDYQAAGATAPTECIKDVENPAQNKYALYEPGSKCYMFPNPTENHVFPFVALVLESSGTSTFCKVKYIITEIDIVPCTGITEDIWNTFDLTGSNSDMTSFSHIRLLGTFNSLKLHPNNVQVKYLPLPNIPEHVIEMLLVQAQFDMTKTTGQEYLTRIESAQTEEINQNLAANPSEKEIRLSKMIPRMIRNDLPGYFLGVSSGPSDDPEKYVQWVDTMTERRPYSLQIVMYLANPGSLTLNKQHTISIVSKAHIFNSLAAKLADLTYSIKVTRTSSTIEFQAYRGAVTSALVSLPYIASDSNYVYLGFTIGHGYLYFTDTQNVKSKTYETLFVFYSGTILSDVKTSTKTENIDALFSTKFWSETNKRWTKVEFLPDSGVITNEGGLRVYSISLGRGIYPALLVSSRAVSAQYTKCFYAGYNSETCFAMAMLIGPDDPQADQVVENDIVKTVSNSDFMSKCKVPFNQNTCLIPKSGYILNMDMTNKKTKDFGKIGEAAYYDSLSQESKDFLREFVNNVGTKYLVSCPWSCKFKS